MELQKHGTRRKRPEGALRKVPCYPDETLTQFKSEGLQELQLSSVQDLRKARCAEHHWPFH